MILQAKLHFSVVCLQDKRLVPGGGATEIELAKQITSYGEVQQIFFNFVYKRSYIYFNLYRYVPLYKSMCMYISAYISIEKHGKRYLPILLFLSNAYVVFNFTLDLSWA